MYCTKQNEDGQQTRQDHKRTLSSGQPGFRTRLLCEEEHCWHGLPPACLFFTLGYSFHPSASNDTSGVCADASTQKEQALWSQTARQIRNDRSTYHTQLAKMSFDEIFDLGAAVVYLFFLYCNIHRIAARLI